MTTETHGEEMDHEANCLMCAVRALTEGDPATTWAPDIDGPAGQMISGVVLRLGSRVTNFGEFSFVDLWTGGTDRVRVWAYAATLRMAIAAITPQIGDRLTVQFDGTRAVETGHFADRGIRQVKMFSAKVQRGH